MATTPFVQKPIDDQVPGQVYPQPAGPPNPGLPAALEQVRNFDPRPYSDPTDTGRIYPFSPAKTFDGQDIHVERSPSVYWNPNFDRKDAAGRSPGLTLDLFRWGEDRFPSIHIPETKATLALSEGNRQKAARFKTPYETAGLSQPTSRVGAGRQPTTRVENKLTEEETKRQAAIEDDAVTSLLDKFKHGQEFYGASQQQRVDLLQRGLQGKRAKRVGAGGLGETASDAVTPEQAQRISDFVQRQGEFGPPATSIYPREKDWTDQLQKFRGDPNAPGGRPEVGIPMDVLRNNPGLMDAAQIGVMNDDSQYPSVRESVEDFNRRHGYDQMTGGPDHFQAMTPRRREEIMGNAMLEGAADAPPMAVRSPLSRHEEALQQFADRGFSGRQVKKIRAGLKDQRAERAKSEKEWRDRRDMANRFNARLQADITKAKGQGENAAAIRAKAAEKIATIESTDERLTSILTMENGLDIAKLDAKTRTDVANIQRESDRFVAQMGLDGEAIRANSKKEGHQMDAAVTMGQWLRDETERESYNKALQSWSKIISERDSLKKNWGNKKRRKDLGRKAQEVLNKAFRIGLGSRGSGATEIRAWYNWYNSTADIM